MESKFFSIRDVQHLLAKNKKPTCYESARRLVQMWNKELESMGYVTFKGLTPKKYALERLGL